MADAWSTVVVPEPEWDDYARSSALALETYEASRCPNCHNYDCLVPLNTETRHVTWEQHDGRVIEVRQYRCIACGAGAAVERDWRALHEKDQPVTGQAAPGDGRMFVTRPLTEEA